MHFFNINIGLSYQSYNYGVENLKPDLVLKLPRDLEEIKNLLFLTAAEK